MAYRPRKSSSFGCGTFVALGCGVVFVCVLLFCGVGAYFGWRSSEEAQKELVEANTCWDTGRKAEAAAKYKSVIGRDLSGIPADSEKPTVYQRVIDFEVEQGRTNDAKAMIEKALDKKIAIPGSKATEGLIAQVRADREKREAEERAAREKREAAEKRDIRVTSQIVKKVEGKYRYFFSIRNDDTEPFEGEVEITLLNNQKGVRNGKESFGTERPIAPTRSAPVYFDINTGPIAVHGDWGVATFRYSATAKGVVVATGEGGISAEFEDLSR